MTPVAIGQVIVFEDRPAVVCKIYGSEAVRLGVIFFDDYSGRVLNDNSKWTATGDVAAQDVVEELLAAHDRVTREYAAEAERVYQDAERLIRAEEAREARVASAPRNRGQ
jgi:hypothetical protein